MNQIIDPPLIKVRKLSKYYGKVIAVREISFTVNSGEILGLIGPDGAGKTTTLSILAGVVKATAGEVKIVNQIPHDVRLAIGYLTQKFSLYLDLSVEENVLYSAGLRKVSPNLFVRHYTKYLLELMDLERFSNRLAGQLSGGMKQKLALCCALISQPQVLLLDEPTTGVDPISRREFWDILATLSAQGMTIVVATPYMDEAERCHRAALMHKGQIQQTGTPIELKDNLGLQRLEVFTNNIGAAEQILVKEIADITDVQSFGERLDILVQNAKISTQQVRMVLQRHQIKINSIRSTEPTLENVFVNRLRQQAIDPPFIPLPRLNSSRTYNRTGEVAIGINNLSKNFGNFQAVKSVTLEVRYGEIYGLLGANGAGKTTTIKILCGLLKASKGSITLVGKTLNLRGKEIRQRLGYMSQKFTLYDDLSIIENLEFYCGVYSIPRRYRRTKIDWVLEISDLKDKKNMITRQLPGGWKQRLAFGAAVMHEPEILFLDEPTSGVDPLARRQFWKLIEDIALQGTAILVTTHHLEEAEHCHRMGFMVSGEMVTQGSPSQIKENQPGQLFEVIVEYPQAALNLLNQQLKPWQVSLFGNSLHVILEHPDVELSQMHSLLQEAKLIINSTREISFSLEDAFISIVQRNSLK
jgi:ABC-2 type transport system ATP-binding protein